MKKTLIAAVLILAASPALAELSAQEKAQIEARIKHPITDAQAVAEAKMAVKAQLKDPSSAQFSGVSVRKRIKSMVIVCGLVNAKNSYGGYGGAHPFTYNSITRGVIMEDNGESLALATVCE